MIDNKVSLKRKLKSAIQLFRPDLAFAAGICVVLGEFIASGSFPALRILLLGFTCGFFISSSALILNDYFDIEVDRVNAPNRPLPAGIISPTEVLVLTALSTLLALVSAAAIGVKALIVSIILWIIGALYNAKLKEAGLLGNVMVSLSVATTFILGGIVVDKPLNKIVITFSFMSFFLDLGEEIASDASDMEGDKKRRAKSIAIVFGSKTALIISTMSFFVVILISFVPIYFKWLGFSYILMILMSDGIIFFSALSLVRSKTPEELRSYIKRIYRGALLGLLAFLISSLIL